MLELQKLPGIGPRSAYRLAFFILRMQDEEAIQLAKSIEDLKQKIRYCRICFNLTENDICSICSDENRDKSVICVVEHPQDAISIENTGEYKGLYHVLGGAISPPDGIGPENLRIRELLERIEKQEIKEIILATNPNVNGELTATYLSRLLSGKAAKITRLATGVPFGGDLDFADEVTIARALQARQTIE